MHDVMDIFDWILIHHTNINIEHWAKETREEQPNYGEELVLSPSTNKAFQACRRMLCLREHFYTYLVNEYITADNHEGNIALSITLFSQIMEQLMRTDNSMTLKL